MDIGKNIPIYKTRLHMIYQAHHISHTRAYKSQNYLHISKKYCTFGRLVIVMDSKGNSAKHIILLTKTSLFTENTN